MRIALIGYGKMGKAIEEIAIERGHTVSAIVDLSTEVKIDSELKKTVDVAIEFTSPEAAKQNLLDCIIAGIPVVSGTTGWAFNENEMNELCKKNSTAVFYASNFSIGVNIFMQINEKLASLLNSFGSYSAKIKETHHIHKLDKPSGTAITLANGIVKNNSKYVKWELNPSTDIQNIEITSFREGEIFGDHSVIWENDIDSINISHSAKSRKGFAMGAVLAAEYINKRTGLFNMRDLLK